MKTIFVLALTATLFSSARAGEKPVAQSDTISQIMVTLYTGPSATQPRGEPIYRLWLRADGTAIYVGGRTYMKRTGRWRGRVAREDFAKLARLFDNKFKASYNGYGRSNIGREAFAVTRAGRSQHITDYESSGPRELKRASQIIYGLLWKIDWQRVSSSDAIDF